MKDEKRNASGAPTILLAEDDDDLREMLAEALRMEGYQVLEARDERGWKEILAKQPHLDLVVTDVEMPGTRDGIALAGQVHALDPKVPILLITGHSYEDVEGVALPKSVGYLAKPFGIGELLKYVDASILPQKNAADKKP